MENIIGKKFNRLLVIRRVKDEQSLYECVCDCGKTVFAYANSIISGNIKSCGCYRLDRIKNLQRKHDMAHTRLYDVWKGLKRRCCNPKNHSYKDYGGRGIDICQQWKDDFMSFYHWSIENGYDENAPYGQCTIDRIDANGNYCPENCRWVSLKEQANNRKNNLLITYNGETDTLSNWSKRIGIGYNALFKRIHDMNWSVEKAFTTPQRVCKRKTT